ncbi:unnamed protein product, partial [Ectocarpus sp. 4 AP-2014]
RHQAGAAAAELEQAKRDLETIKEASRCDKRELQARVDSLQDVLASAARSASHLPNAQSAGKGSPLFSEDQGAPSPLPPPPPDIRGSSSAGGAGGGALGVAATGVKTIGRGAVDVGGGGFGVSAVAGASSRGGKEEVRGGR